jgi:ribulose-phosphate 3-epimerase
MQVIPAINAPDFETAKEQIKEAVEFSEWVHLDITDGVFSPAVLWGSPEELQKLTNSPTHQLKFEVHLMVSNPEGVIDYWLRTGLVKRVIIHLEAMTDSVYILAKCKKYDAEAMLAINPGTEVERLLAHKEDFKNFQVLAVAPGWAGQKFNQKMIDKIKFLRANMPNAIIEVDGGINPQTAKLCKKAGADVVISASYIFSGDNPRKRFEELLRI